MPKVSIIVPCWGVEKYLNQCVKSLVGQTLKDIEIILVDDESPDRVPEMCDDWAKKDSRIKVVHKKNGGLGLACNSGLEIATGEYVAFCDSDDWVERETYETMCKSAMDSNAELVMTSFKYVAIDGSPLEKQSITYKKYCYAESEVHEVMKGLIASPPCISDERQFQASAKVTLYKNSIIKDNNVRFVSERVIPSEDLIFNLDYLSHCNRVLTIPEKFYNYRFNPNSITHIVKSDAFVISKNLYKHLRNKVMLLGLGDDGVHRVQRMFIGTTRAIVSKILKSSMAKKDKYSLLNEICKDATLCDIANDYPTSVMPLKHRAFLFATTHNMKMCLSLMSKSMH